MLSRGTSAGGWAVGIRGCDFRKQLPAFLLKMSAGTDEGKIKYREDIVDGLKAQSITVA